MMGNTGTGFFGGLGRTAKLMAFAMGFGTLAVLLGIIVGVFTDWKIGLLTFAVIGLVAAYYFFRALQQQARNVSTASNFVGDLLGGDHKRAASARDDDRLFSGPPLFGSSTARPTRHVPTTSSSTSHTSSGSAAYVDPGMGSDREQSASPFEDRPQTSEPANDSSSSDGHTIHDSSTSSGHTPSDTGGSTTSSDGGGSFTV